MNNLQSLDDFCAFAKRLRGPFAIVVSDGSVTTALSDFGACYPVYYLKDSSGQFRVAHTLAELRQYATGEISRDALFFYAGMHGIGQQPLYAGAETLPPATVMRFEQGQIVARQYMDWEDALEPQPIDKQTAFERFIEISHEYILAVTANKPAGVFLSGGADSAIAAYLLKGCCPDVVCLTADYSIRKYSEFSRAAHIAKTLGLRHERVPVDRAAHYAALRRMNSSAGDLPVHHSQATSLYALAIHARRAGVTRLFHGENAGAIFMEFDSFFAGFSKNTQEYLAQTARLSAEDKLRRLAPEPGPLGRHDEQMLQALGISAAGYMPWRRGMMEADRRLFSRWVDHFPFPAISQLPAQIWAGVFLRNGWLPAEAAAGVETQFLSPFLDMKMIRFALSLPVEFKYRDGVTKAFLREFLEQKTGIKLPKVSSPNQSRVWSLMPDPASFRGDPRLRSLLLKSALANLRSLGGLHSEAARIAALSMWLKSHRMGEVHMDKQSAAI